MLYRFGQLINWLGVIAFWGLVLVAMAFWTSDTGVAVVFIVFGGVVWLASRALRYLFSGDWR